MVVILDMDSDMRIRTLDCSFFVETLSERNKIGGRGGRETQEVDLVSGLELRKEDIQIECILTGSDSISSEDLVDSQQQVCLDSLFIVFLFPLFIVDHTGGSRGSRPCC